MGTSGTGHTGARLKSLTRLASGTPPLGGNGKIKKSNFGFKGGAKKILPRA
jgi:hypothetical protein